MPPELLLIEDNSRACSQIQQALEEDFKLIVAWDRPEALSLFRQIRPAVVILDLISSCDPQKVEEGFCTLRAILEEEPSTKVLISTYSEQQQYALEAIEQGAYDFFYKPVHFDELKKLVSRAFYAYQSKREHCVQKFPEAFGEILGASLEMREVFTIIRRVATTDASVIIRGASGTGKELVAKAIHHHSLRQTGPFIAINCGAIPENLLESELFGYEKGAFTGAYARRKGRIELAQGGTLFLDEIGELSLALQVKLLRFLQERHIERVGGREAIAVDVRVLVATHVDLEQAIKQRRFRADLYYRLNVVEITLPPLHQRGDDILLLAQALLHRYTGEYARRLDGFDPSTIAALMTYDWPGNVRELENRLRRAIIMAAGPLLTPEDLGFSSQEATFKPQTLQEARKTIETNLIRQALARNNRNISRTAAELGVSRPTLRELMRKYALRSEV